MDDILAFIKKEDPDVLALQEVYDGHDLSWERKFRSMDVLRDALDYSHEHFAPAFLERTEFGKVEQGNAVFSRHPIDNTSVVFFDQPYGEREDAPGYYKTTPRNLQRVDILVPEGPLSIFNTQGIWGTHGDDSDRRLAMGRTIAREISKTDKYILGGDFNVKEGTKTVGLIEEFGENVFSGSLKSSFNLREKKDPGFAVAVVDMVFSSSNVKVIEKSCPDIDVSDHLPLIVTFEAVS